MKVNNDTEQLNIRYSAVGMNKVPYSSQAAMVNNIKDSFRKGAVSAPVTKTTSNLPFLYFSNNPKLLLRTYMNEHSINKMANSNPKVKELLDANGIEYSVHPENVLKMINSHLTTTTAYALQIANNLKLSAYDKQMLELACVFHDFGKAVIPTEIVNKRGALTSEEKQIMNLHSQLGYELLSQTGINKTVLNLVKDHHHPKTDDILAQILSVADMYSALREERCYKKPLSNKEALNILDQKVKDGEVSAEVVDALKSSVPKDSCAA